MRKVLDIFLTTFLSIEMGSLFDFFRFVCVYFLSYIWRSFGQTWFFPEHLCVDWD